MNFKKIQMKNVDFDTCLNFWENVLNFNSKILIVVIIDSIV
jgi:hypothetical protein